MSARLRACLRLFYLAWISSSKVSSVNDECSLRRAGGGAAAGTRARSGGPLNGCDRARPPGSLTAGGRWQVEWGAMEPRRCLAGVRFDGRGRGLVGPAEIAMGEP